MSDQPKGKLKIFLGYCAGCGKTYAMLQAAHKKQAEGVDVVAGYIEPHDRKETMALVEGLETIPVKDIAYRNIIIHEFDIDAALTRKPQLILVDELAHTNAHGSRHIKRFSDIKELLHAGIDVYTTLNIQHLESLYDIISKITRISVNERIPDKILDDADQVEFIDIEPDDVLKRLMEGKIYPKTKVQTAMRNFFLKDNLTALRELALRRLADRMNLLNLTRSKTFTKEHILVCLSSSKTNAKVIRTAARLAQAFNADFSALYIETENQNENMDADDLEMLKKNRDLASNLHADIVSVYGENIAESIYEFASVSAVSKVVIGWSAPMVRGYHKTTLMDELQAYDADFDIYIIPDKKHAPKKARRTTYKPEVHFDVKNTIYCVVALVAATIVGLIFQHYGITESNTIMLYLLSVVVISYSTNWYYALASCLCAVLMFNFFFTLPIYSLEAYDPTYIATFVIMFLVSLIISTLTGKIKRQSFINASQVYRTAILLETSQKLQVAETMSDLAKTTCEQLYKLLDRTIIIYTVRDNKLQVPFIYQKEFDPREEDLFLSSNETTVAEWVLRNNRMAGVSTSTLSGCHALYMAVRKKETIYAVVGIAMEPHEQLPPFEKSVLTTIINEIALSMDAMNKR